VLRAALALDGAHVVPALRSAEVVQTRAQVEELRDQVRSVASARSDRAGVVIGRELGTDRHAIAAAGLRDSLVEDETPTWPTCETTFGAAWRQQLRRSPDFSLSPRRLDYLLSRGVLPLRAQVRELRQGPEYASDHALVTASFQLRLPGSGGQDADALAWTPPAGRAAWFSG